MKSENNVRNQNEKTALSSLRDVSVFLRWNRVGLSVLTTSGCNILLLDSFSNGTDDNAPKERAVALLTTCVAQLTPMTNAGSVRAVLSAVLRFDCMRRHR